MVYHVYNRSIAEFTIFNNNSEYSRIIDLIHYYQKTNPSLSFSKFIESKNIHGHSSSDNSISLEKKDKLVEIINYCPMPTHLHLTLEELKEKGISIFISNVLNAYTRYFNLRHNRRGPLWESRTKKVLVETDDLLLHISRYIHLNPTTAHIIKKPEEWPHSSYTEYISGLPASKKICKFDHLLDIEIDEYKKFCEDQISYQRSLAKIKHLILE